MSLKSFLSILPLLFVLSCSEDFDVTAEWKDITIVYGLLNPNEPDSVHYVKINKAYLNEGLDAIKLASVLDSTVYKDSLYVRMLELNGSSVLRTIPLFREVRYNKDTNGIFASPENVLYRTERHTILNPVYKYKLLITNPKTGKEVSAETEIINAISTQFPKDNQYLPFTFDNELEFQWYSGKNAYFYNLEIDIVYNEYPKSNPTQKVQKIIKWPLFTYRRADKYTQGNVLMKQVIKGQTFFNLLIDNIPEDFTKEREFVRFNLYFTAGGREIYYYININKPSAGTIQKKPEYTNIQNGYGIFSTRGQTIIRARLSPTSSSILTTDARTINLNFVK